jgi:glycosyltransferase involved in cell wall biosynthesis
MFRGLSVAVVVPAFNEVDKIGRTLASVPSFVDRIVVVDDGSSDDTAAVASAAAPAGPSRTEIVRHQRNLGVGRAIASGYRRALELGTAAVVVMAGDAQMDPADLDTLLTPLASGSADYAKGNRFLWPGCTRLMPPVRVCGNVVLSALTRIACGLWHIGDSQCGYTAIARPALAGLALGEIFPRYGYPNDILSRLSLAGARVVDVPVRPVYGPGWRSGLSPARVALPITYVLARALGRRLHQRASRALRRAHHVLPARID